MNRPPLSRHNPRHPYPERRDEFGPRGWVVSRTSGGLYGRPLVHAVLCALLPVECSRAHGFTEHVAAPPEAFRAAVARHADAIERHAKTCAKCVLALAYAIEDAEVRQ